MKPVMSAAPSTPSPKHTHQVVIALRPCRPRNDFTSISNPAMRNSIPNPSSFSSGIPPSLPDASPSTFGPISIPKISKNTTSGMRLPISRDITGDTSATRETQKIETYWAVPSTLVLSAAAPEATNTCEAPVTPCAATPAASTPTEPNNPVTPNSTDMKPHKK